MDDVPNRFARDLADAIAAAVAQSADVDACRDRARQAGYLLKVSLEATIGFSSLPGQPFPESGNADEAAGVPDEPQPFEVSANDRRFLRSLRIAADEINVEEPN